MQIITEIAKPFDKILRKQRGRPKVNYRPMNFVVEQPVDDGLLLYHTMTKAMLLLSPEEAERYHQAPAALPQLIAGWFVVPQDHDDRLLSRQIRHIAKLLEKHATAITSYTILTTTDCNARCFYCYEMGRPRIPMRKDIALKTADYISAQCEGEKVNLTWFGGEPLFNKPVINTICDRLREARVEFSSKMISNGYLFDDQTVRDAVERWHLKRVQITLDGTEKVYNRSKAYIYKGVNAYRWVLDNIHRLMEADITVTIRLNIDNHNADNLLDLADELHEEFGEAKRLQVYLHQLFETSSSSMAMHSEENRKIIFRKMQEIEQKLEQYGFMHQRTLIDKIKVNRCMADHDQSIVILPTGDIGKCEHYSDDHFIGHIDQGKQWDQEMVGRFRECHNEIEACSTCFYYPNCIWLKMCENIQQCHEEERAYKLYHIQKAMISTYKKFINGKKETTQDEVQD